MGYQNLQNSWLSVIRFTRLRFFYQATRAEKIDYFLGPEIRGSIGHLLKNYMGCDGHGHEDCKRCPTETQMECLYAPFYLNGSNYTMGFVLKLDPAFRAMKTHFNAWETIHFDLLLIGKNTRWALHVINALKRQNLVLGKNKLPFNLIEAGFVDNTGTFNPINQINQMPRNGFCLFDAPPEQDLARSDRVSLIMHTPTEIRLPRTSKKREYLRNPSDLNFRLLIQTVLRRIQDIAREHCHRDDHHPDDIPGKKELLELSEHIDLWAHNARWAKVKIRNKPGKIFGGLTGNNVYKGDFTPFWPILNAAAVLGIGRGTTYGFGHISCEHSK